MKTAHSILNGFISGSLVGIALIYDAPKLWVVAFCGIVNMFLWIAYLANQEKG